MSYKSLKFQISGVSPLLMHNGQLADPLNDVSRKMKAVSSKRAKTDADYIELARLEWYGSLYLDGGKPCLPGEVIEAALVSAAKKNKRGKQAQAGIICPRNFPLRYKDESDLETMWAGNNHRLTVGVRIQNSRVMRTRPKFENWSAEIEVMYDPQVMNEQEIKDTVRIAGDAIGLCDWRPKFGRFEVVN